MGVSISETKQLSWWEYTAAVCMWNDRHTVDGDKGEPVEPPPIELIIQQQQRMIDLGIVSGSKH